MPASNFFDQYTQPRRRPVGGSPAFASAPTSTGRSPYDATPFASMHNGGANDFFNRTGTMPRTTYGGNFGQAITNPDNRLSGQQVLNAASGNQYAPMHMQPMGMAPTNMTQYGAQMSQQNPNGTFFGGALPAYQTSIGGNVRPMFVGAPTNLQGPDPANLAAAHYGLSQRGYSRRDNGQGGTQWYNPSANVPQAQQAAAAMFDARRGGLQQRQQDYQQRNFFDMGQRNAGVLNNAQNRADARRARMGIGDPTDMAMRQNPQIAGMMGMQQLQNQNSQGWMQHQAGMFQQGQMADQRNQYMQRMAELAGALPGMGLPPGVQQGYMNHIMQQFGMPGQPNGGQATGTGAQRANHYLTPQQQGQLRGMKPAEREAKLNEWGITDTVTRQHLLGVNGMSDPATGNLWTDLSNGFWGGLGSFFAGGYESPRYAHPTLVPTPAGKDGKRGVKPRTPYRPMFPTPAAPGMPEFAGPMY